MPENLLIIMCVIGAVALYRVTKAHQNDVRYNKKLNRKNYV